jgi:hypothetical protein
MNIYGVLALRQYMCLLTLGVIIEPRQTFLACAALALSRFSPKKPGQVAKAGLCRTSLPLKAA